MQPQCKFVRPLDGRLFVYAAPVFDVEPCGVQAIGVPPFDGFLQFVHDNSSFCSRTSKLHLLFDVVGVEDCQVAATYWHIALRACGGWTLVAWGRTLGRSV